MPQIYESWPAGVTAGFDVTVRQDNAGGGTITLKIAPGGGGDLIIMSLHVKMGTVAAARTVSLSHRDADGDQIVYVGGASIDTNEFCSYPAAPAATGFAASGEWAPMTLYQLIISGTDYFRIDVSAAAQNEVIAIWCRYRIPSGEAALSVGTDNTLTTNYHKVT